MDKLDKWMGVAVVVMVAALLFEKVGVDIGGFDYAVGAVAAVAVVALGVVRAVRKSRRRF